jgi:hypothetical protein
MGQPMSCFKQDPDAGDLKAGKHRNGSLKPERSNSKGKLIVLISML